MAAPESFQDKYKEVGKFQNPKRGNEPLIEHVHRKCQYIFSNYIQGVDATGYNSKEKFELLRLYGAGKQAEEIYKPYFLGSESKSENGTFNNAGFDIGGANAKFDSSEFARKALGHINWRIMSPMGKIKDKIHSSFAGNMYDINIECIDENSIDEQQTKKYRAWVESQAETIAFMKNLQQITGIPYEEPKAKIATISELELHEANGAFKLNYAKEGEKIIKDAWNISNQDEIDEKILNDLTDINIAGYRVEYDRELGKEVVRYIDPANAGIQHSKHNDFRDSSYAYEVIFEPAYKLQSLGIKPDQLPKIASRYAGMFGNPVWSDQYEWIENAEPLVGCGFFKVPILDVEWIDVDVDKEVKYTTRFGTQQIRPYQEGEKLSANKQYQETKIHKVYQAKWVIDTDILYDWGLKPNQPRREKKQAVLSFHFIKGKTDKSLVERLLPVLDDFQLTWLKYQDAKASAVKSGLAIEFGSLIGMKMGGGELSPFDIIDIYRKTGDVFYKRNQRHLGTSQPMPITPLQGGMGNIINELVLALDTNAKLIEEITGINPVSLGATADSSSPVGTMQMSVANSSSPIKNIFDKIFLLKAHTSLDLLQRVQLDLRNSKTVQGRYAAVIGHAGVQTLIGAEAKGVGFGFKLVARPTPEKIAKLEEYIAVALQAGKNGVAGITVAEAMNLVRRIEAGAPWTEIEQFIDYSEKQRIAAEEQARAQAADQQGQLQQQYAQVTGEQERIKLQMEAEKENLMLSTKAYYQVITDNNASANKIKEIKAQAGIFDQPTPVPQMPTPDTTIDGLSPEQLAQQQAAQQQQPQTQIPQ